LLNLAADFLLAVASRLATTWSALKPSFESAHRLSVKLATAAERRRHRRRCRICKPIDWHTYRNRRRARRRRR